jgi:hypothetical protein
MAPGRSSQCCEPCSLHLLAHKFHEIHGSLFSSRSGTQLSVAACGLCRKNNKTSQALVFEDKYPIEKNIFGNPPNIDVVIYNDDSVKTKRFAIECKFTEAYTSRSHGGLKPAYLALTEIWRDIPNIHNLAKSICPDDKRHHYLHPAQLIKHILGLKKARGKEGFRLIYLWYDVFGSEGAVHRNEVEIFSELAASDNVIFKQ